MTRRGGGLRGREAYEYDLKQTPNYPDGRPRRSWDELEELVQWSWIREPKPRLCGACRYANDEASDYCAFCGAEIS